MLSTPWVCKTASLVAVAATLALVALSGPPVGDFFNYYAAAHAWWSGVGPEALADLPDYRWFADQAARAGLSDQLVGFAVLTPPSVLIAVPLLPFSPELAAIVWQGLQAALLLLCGLGIGRACERPLWWGMLPFACLLPAVRSHLYQGQFHLLAVVAVSWAMVAWNRDRKVLAGAAWALAVGFKVHAWPVLAVLAIWRSKRALAAAAATLAAGAVVSVVLLGWPVHAAWLHEGLPAGAAGLYLDPWHAGFQSLGHGLRRLLIPHPVLNPGAVWNAPGLAGGLAGAVHGIIVGLTLAAAARGGCREDDGSVLPPQVRVLSAAAIAALVSGPILSTYHFVLLAPPVGWTFDVFWRAGRRTRALVLLLTTGVVAAVPSLPQAPALLSVPRAWLALLLWALIVPLPRRPARALVLAAALAAVFAAGGAARSSRWFAVTDGARPFDHPKAPFAAAELLRSEDGLLWFSGFSLHRQGHPGRGWMGWRWDPDDSTGPRVVAADAHRHVWAPRAVDRSTVAWTHGPAEVRAPGCDLSDGRRVEARDHDGQVDLALAQADGTLTWITRHPAHDTDPVCDAPRARIWFLSDRGVGSRGLRLWWVPMPPTQEKGVAISPPQREHEAK